MRSTFAPKPKTKVYYENGIKNLLAYEKLAGERLDSITSEKVAGYVAKRQEAGLQVASINRELQVLRRMFHLAQEWGKVEKVLPRLRMLSGERHRERVLSFEEEKRYLAEARTAAARRGDDLDRLRPSTGRMLPSEVGKHPRRLH